ncbi:MAG TPA: M28 family metallopeptidase [Fimbriimonadaceae bacterium]|nr:M28 family metallopeptidase [Fimbriimonadaceae bacterium]
MLAMLALTMTLQMNPDDMIRQVDPKRLRANVEKLASWHDRNTNNPTVDEAADWMAAQYRAIPGLNVEVWHYPVKKGPRIKEDREVPEVIATLPGATDRRVIIGGHIDTINMSQAREDPSSQWTLPSPGADDDASGACMALEVARIMAQQKWSDTIVFVAFTGEEQGLFGSAALAKRAKEEGWKIDAVLSSDIIGSSKDQQGFSDPHHIRLFSEELPSGARDREGALLPPHNSRELARIIEFFTRDRLRDFSVKLVFRADRFGRGGDHTSFNRQGFSAVRFTEPYEDYTHEHTAEDLPKYMDWNYLANVTKINLLAMMQLANAQQPPTEVRVATQQSHDAELRWSGPVTQEYVVYWRQTTAPTWEFSKRVGPVTSTVIPKVSKDDCVFAVGAVGGVPVEAR